MAACPAPWIHFLTEPVFASPSLPVTITYCFSHFWKSVPPAGTETPKYPISTVALCIAKYSAEQAGPINNTGFIAMKSVLLPYSLQSGNCFFSVKNKYKRRKGLDTNREDLPDQRETDRHIPQQVPVLVQNLQGLLLLFHITIPLIQHGAY